MRLIKFTNNENDQPVYVNPNSVGAIMPEYFQADATVIIVMGYKITVKDNINDVYAAIKGQPAMLNDGAADGLLGVTFNG